MILYASTSIKSWKFSEGRIRTCVIKKNSKISIKSESFSGCALFLKANEILKSYACFWILWNCFEKEKSCFNIKFLWLYYAGEICDTNTFFCRRPTKKIFKISGKCRILWQIRWQKNFWRARISARAPIEYSAS